MEHVYLARQVVKDVEQMNLEGIITFESKYALEATSVAKAIADCIDNEAKI